MPFLKWIGGKSQVLHVFKDYFPDFYSVKGYIEPFCVCKDSVVLLGQQDRIKIQDIESRKDKQIDLFGEFDYIDNVMGLDIEHSNEEEDRDNLIKTSHIGNFFVKDSKDTDIYNISTRNRRSLNATGDHIFLTKNKDKLEWKQLKDIKYGDMVAIFPSIIPLNDNVYKEKIILDEQNIIDNIPDNTDREKILRELKNAGLLPLTNKNPKLYIIARLYGFLVTDGSLSEIRCKGEMKKTYVHTRFIGGNKLFDVLKDIKLLGINVGANISDIREKFTSDTTWGKCSDIDIYTKTIFILFKALGAPIGKKTDQAYKIPQWIYQCCMRVKQEFLGGIMGGDGTTVNYYNRKHPSGRIIPDIVGAGITQSKITDLESSLLEYLHEICILLNEFGLKYRLQYVGKKSNRDDGKEVVTYRIDLLDNHENTLRFLKYIGYRYDNQKIMISYPIYEYLLSKEKRIGINNRISRGNSFPVYERWEKTYKLDGIVFDEVIIVRKIEYSGKLYDISVEKTHNYIVNEFVTHNCGGGSVFFYVMENYRGALEGKPIFISDINKELINCYKIVRDNVDNVIPLLEEHQKLNSEEHYYEIRKKYPPGNDMADIEKAAAFIYLSRAAFGGLWRVNSEGKMNAPFNKNPAIKIMDDDLYHYSRLLKPANINVMSFENILKINKGNLKDWFVYCCLLGTKIRMSDERLLNIEDIKKDDKTFIGGKVIDIFERDYNGKIFEFEIMGIYDNLCVTEEHPLAIIRQNDAYQILERYSDGRIHISKFKNQEALNRLDIKFIRSKDINIGDFLLAPCYPENILDIKTVKIGDIEIDCNEEFGYIIGFWLAEGHIEHYYGKYCIDKDRLNDIKTGKQSTIFDIFDTGDSVDEDIDELIKKNDCDSSYILEYSCGKLDFDHGFIDRLNKWYNRYFKITGNVYKLPWECWQISYHVEELAKFLHKNFGEGAENKKISNEILNYPLEFQKGLLRGWTDGDGGIWGDERNRCKITGTSVSRQLALDMYLIALRLGLRPALKYRESGKYKGSFKYDTVCWDTYFSSQDDVKYLYPNCHDFSNSKTRSQRRIITKGNKKFILTPITKIIKREYRGKVYNLQTEKHVYIIDYVLSHNCDPPYADTGQGAFTGYSKDGYHTAKRDLLPKVFRELDKRGAKVMMSNADVPAIRSYFSDFNINVIKTNRQTGIQLSSITKEKIENTGKLNEVVVTNYKFGKGGKQTTIDDTWV